MSTETKRKAIEAWREGCALDAFVDALEALMREVADERIAAHLPSKRVAVSDPSHPGETKPEPAKCAECGAYGPGSDLQNYGHTVGCSKHPEYGSKATPPSAKGPPMPEEVWVRWDGPGGGAAMPRDTWTAVSKETNWRIYLRADLVAAKVAEAKAAERALIAPGIRQALGATVAESLQAAARRVVARVAELEARLRSEQDAAYLVIRVQTERAEAAEKRVRELEEASAGYLEHGWKDLKQRAEKAETELAEVRAKLSDAHQVIEAARKKLWEVKP